MASFEGRITSLADGRLADAHRLAVSASQQSQAIEDSCIGVFDSLLRGAEWSRKAALISGEVRRPSSSCGVRRRL